MKRLLSFSLLPLMLLTCVSAVEHPYQAGKITHIEQKVNTEVLYYIVNTPVTRDHPYYEVSLQLKDVIYVGEYTPRHSADALPAEWDAGTDVQARIESKTIFLKRPEGRDLSLAIIKRSVAKSPPSNSP